MRGIAFFSRHPIATFLVLIYPLSWYSWLLGYADARGSTGLNPLGPLAAALITTWLAGGWPRFREWIAHFGRFRGGVGPYLAALAIPVVICATAAAANIALGASAPTIEQLRTWPGMIEQFIVVLAFVALGEEPGWRGFLTPEAQKRTAPFAAALGVALVWAIWHAPLFRSEITPELVRPFLLGLLGAALVLAWLRNLSRAVWPPMVCHALVNTIGAGFFFTFYEGADLVRLWWIYSSLWAAAGLAVALVTRGSLGASEGADLHIRADGSRDLPEARRAS
jgi:membrane protease YdiL (CAAX protease family)